MFRNLICAVLTILLISGCATATRMYGADGNEMQLIECPGMAVPLGACFDKANEVCPRGYFLIDRQTGGEMATFTPEMGMYASGVNKSIVVRCK